MSEQGDQILPSVEQYSHAGSDEETYRSEHIGSTLSGGSTDFTEDDSRKTQVFQPLTSADGQALVKFYRKLGYSLTMADAQTLQDAINLPDPRLIDELKRRPLLDLARASPPLTSEDTLAAINAWRKNNIAFTAVDTAELQGILNSSVSLLQKCTAVANLDRRNGGYREGNTSEDSMDSTIPSKQTAVQATPTGHSNFLEGNAMQSDVHSVLRSDREVTGQGSSSTNVTRDKLDFYRAFSKAASESRDIVKMRQGQQMHNVLTFGIWSESNKMRTLDELWRLWGLGAKLDSNDEIDRQKPPIQVPSGSMGTHQSQIGESAGYEQFPSSVPRGQYATPYQNAGNYGHNQQARSSNYLTPLEPPVWLSSSVEQVGLARTFGQSSSAYLHQSQSHAGNQTLLPPQPGGQYISAYQHTLENRGGNQTLPRPQPQGQNSSAYQYTIGNREGNQQLPLPQPQTQYSSAYQHPIDNRRDNQILPPRQHQGQYISEYQGSLGNRAGNQPFPPEQPQGQYVTPYPNLVGTSATEHASKRSLPKKGYFNGYQNPTGRYKSEQLSPGSARRNGNVNSYQDPIKIPTGDEASLRARSPKARGRGRNNPLRNLSSEQIPAPILPQKRRGRPRKDAPRNVSSEQIPALILPQKRRGRPEKDAPRKAARKQSTLRTLGPKQRGRIKKETSSSELRHGTYSYSWPKTAYSSPQQKPATPPSSSKLSSLSSSGNEESSSEQESSSEEGGSSKVKFQEHWSSKPRASSKRPIPFRPIGEDYPHPNPLGYAPLSALRSTLPQPKSRSRSPGAPAPPFIPPEERTCDNWNFLKEEPLEYVSPSSSPGVGVWLLASDEEWASESE